MPLHTERHRGLGYVRMHSCLPDVPNTMRLPLFVCTGAQGNQHTALPREPSAAAASHRVVRGGDALPADQLPRAVWRAGVHREGQPHPHAGADEQGGCMWVGPCMRKAGRGSSVLAKDLAPHQPLARVGGQVRNTPSEMPCLHLPPLTPLFNSGGPGPVLLLPDGTGEGHPHSQLCRDQVSACSKPAAMICCPSSFSRCKPCACLRQTLHLLSAILLTGFAAA